MMQFPIEDISPTSPVTRGMQNAINIYSQFMQALQAPEQMAMQKANLQKLQLENKYYPQVTQSDINYKNALIKAMQQKPEAWQSDIGKTQADLKKIRDTYGVDSDEYKGAMNQLNTQLAMQQAKTASSNAYADMAPFNTLPQTAKDSIFASFLQSGMPSEYFPTYASQMTKRYLLSQPGAQQSPGQPGQMPGQPVQGIPTATPNPMPINPQDVQALAQSPQATALGATVPQTPPQAPMQSAVGPALAQQVNPAAQVSPEALGIQVSPEQQQESKDLSDVIRSKVIKEGSTNTQLNQRLFGDMFKNLTDKITPNMDAITKFSGTYGKTGAALDKALANIGSSRTDPDYVKYDQFMHVDLPLGANELRRTMAGQATDAEIKSVTDVFNPTDWAVNPKMAMNRWNRMLEMANTARKSGYKTQAQMAREFSQEDQPSVSQQLAEKTGMKSPSEKSAEPVKIPSFNSKADFQAWFKQQSPAVQAAIKQKMGAQ